jgi:lipopolysaccharide heptosyltransferase II
MNPANDWTDVRRVLCVRLDCLGDVLMTTPALAALATGGRQVTLLTSSAGAPIAPLLPMVDQTIVYDAPWMKATPPQASAANDREMIDRLRREGFDAAVIFTVYSQNPLPAALLCYLADIPLRLAHARENPYQLLTHWIKEPEPEQFVRHEAQRQLDLVGAVGVHANDTRLSVDVPRSAIEEARALLVANDVDVDAPWIAVHPGASAPSRRYPPEYFALAARQLVLDHGLQLVFTGSRVEAPLIEQIIAAAEVEGVSLAGQTNLGALAAVLKQASLLISNNTGPVHLAAAVGTPIVDLYAQTNLQHTPWQVPHELLFHEVPCKNCYKSICPEQHHDCLRRVPPSAVVASALRLLGKADVRDQQSAITSFADA